MKFVVHRWLTLTIKLPVVRMSVDPAKHNLDNYIITALFIHVLGTEMSLHMTFKYIQAV